tara:strand:- start:89 stop:472 length:384 start_codon:yes stop_codon:yes gene_type:complete
LIFRHLGTTAINKDVLARRLDKGRQLAAGFAAITGQLNPGANTKTISPLQPLKLDICPELSANTSAAGSSGLGTGLVDTDVVASEGSEAPAIPPSVVRSTFSGDLGVASGNSLETTDGSASTFWGAA